MSQRLTGAVRGWTAWVCGGLAGLADDLLAARRRGGDETCRMPDPSRPDWVAFRRWRRMTRLSRAASVTVGSLLRAHPDVDRDQVPVIWGSQLGEVADGAAFLDRLFTEGPDRVSPMAFQNSVYNATLGHLALAFSLRGPQETICAGAASGAATLARGIEWLARSPHVVVVAGDALAHTSTAAYRAAGLRGGESVVAILLHSGDDVAVHDGVDRTTPPIGRATALPFEHAFRAVGGPIHPEVVLGHCATNELLAWLVSGQDAVAQDDGVCLTLRATSLPAPTDPG